MGKRSLWLAISFCLCAYLGIAAFSLYRYATTKSAIKKTAEREFDNLVDIASAAAVLGFMEEPFKEALRETVDHSETIVALIVTGPEGPEFAYETTVGYLSSDPKFLQFVFLPGTSDLSYYAPLRYEGVRNATIRALVLSISPAKVFTILRDAACCLLIPIFVAALCLILAAETRPDRAVGEAKPQSVDEMLLKVKQSADQTVNEPSSGRMEHNLLTRLNSELHQSAINEQELSFLIIEPRQNPQAWLRNFDAIIKAAESFFLANDRVFKWDDQGLAAILLDTDIDQAFNKAETFLNDLRSNSSDLVQLMISTDPRIGLSARAGRLVNAERLSLEAAQALKKALNEVLSPIVAFKPDLARYRAFLAQSSGNDTTN